MSLEHIDVQCTVVAHASPKRIIRALRQRATQNACHIEKLESTDLASNPLSPDAVWPAETLGEMVYTTATQASRTLFWSTYAQGDISMFHLGLYLREYACADDDLRQAYDTAFNDTTALFNFSESRCIAASLEDEPSLGCAPRLVGRYRPDLWKKLGIDHLPGMSVQNISTEWIEVRPMELDSNPYLGITEMSEPAARSLRALQERLEEIFWGFPRGVH